MGQSLGAERAHDSIALGGVRILPGAQPMLVEEAERQLKRQVQLPPCLGRLPVAGPSAGVGFERGDPSSQRRHHRRCGATCHV
jgi:hypothetical protein